MTQALRVPHDEDVALVARLMSENWPDPMDEETVRLSWTSPGLDRELDTRLDESGYAIVESLDDERVWIDLRGSPSETLLIGPRRVRRRRDAGSSPAPRPPTRRSALPSNGAGSASFVTPTA